MFVFLSYSQQTGRMETDRPDQTESPFIVRRNYLQGELGFNIERSDGLTTIIHPTALWKYGLIERFELRLITQVQSQETPLQIPAGNKIKTGLVPVTIGGKLALFEEKGLLPKTSVITHVSLPRFASKFYHAARLAPEFRFTMQHTLSENVGLGYNLGMEWDGESTSPFYIYTFGPGFNIGKRVYAYVELFGDFQRYSNPTHNFDAGIAYYISDNMKADLSSGLSLTTSRQYYVAVGFSFRIKAF